MTPSTVDADGAAGPWLATGSRVADSYNLAGERAAAGISTDEIAKMTESLQPGELGHGLRARHVTMIALGGVIGAGLFVGSGSAIAQAGPGVLLAYVACGIIVILIMRMLGEMAVAEPGRGSFAEYAALGLGPWAGFVIRWSYWYGLIFALGAETAGAAKLLHEAGFPAPPWAIGLALMSIMTTVNMLSVRVFGEVEFWFAMIKVFAIIGFVTIGLWFLCLHNPSPHRIMDTFTRHGGWLPFGFVGLIAALPVVMFSMSGSETATIAATESDHPAANVAKAVRSVALRIVIFYISSVVIITAVVPWSSVVPGLSPFKLVLDVIGIPWSGALMSAIVITAVLSALNANIYNSSRMLYELARNGEGPRFLKRTARNKTPVVGVILCGALGSAAALAELFVHADMFTMLAGSAGATVMFIYLLIACAQIRFRRRAEAEGRVLPMRMWLYPWLSYAVVAAIVMILSLLAWMPNQRAPLVMSAVAAAAVIVAQRLHRGSITSTAADTGLN